MGTTRRLLAVGDSIIAGVGAAHLADALVGQTAAALADILQCRIEWTARGAIGATSRLVLDRIVPSLPEPPADFIVLSVGVNDITGLIRISPWKLRLGALLDALHHHSPTATIAVAGIPPLGVFPLLPQPLRALFGVRGKAFDAAARAVIARHPYAVHVPVHVDPDPTQFSSDGYHPSEAGYEVFGRTIAEHLLRSD